MRLCSERLTETLNANMDFDDSGLGWAVYRLKIDTQMRACFFFDIRI